jgi:excisionase family DNA binding protein
MERTVVAGEYLTVDEVAATRGLNRKTVYAAIRSGRLPAENWGSDERPLFRVHRVALAEVAYRPRDREPGNAVAQLRPVPARGTFARLARDGEYG